MSNIFKNIVAGTISNILIFLTNLILSIFLVRYLGPENRGLYFLVISTSAMIVTIATLGVNMANTIHIAKKQYNLNEINTNSILFSIGVGVLIITFYLISKNSIPFNILPNVSTSQLLVGMISVPFVLYSTYWNSMMVGLDRIIFLNVFGLFSTIVNLIVTLIVIFIFDAGLNGILSWWLFFNILVAFAMLLSIVVFDKVRMQFNTKIARESLSLGLQSHLGVIAYQTFLRLDSFILNYFAGAAAVGYYSVALGLSERIWIVVGSIYTATTAKITGEIRERAIELTQIVSRHVFFFLSITALILILLSHWIIKFLYGEAFLPAVVPLMILLIGTISLGVWFQISLFIVGQERKPLISSLIQIITLIISVALYFILIPKFGSVGAALASAITYFATLLFGATYFIKSTSTLLRDLFIFNRSDLNYYISLIRKAKEKLLKGI